MSLEGWEITVASLNGGAVNRDGDANARENPRQSGSVTVNVNVKVNVNVTGDCDGDCDGDLRRRWRTIQPKIDICLMIPGNGGGGREKEK
jgi:hypothetical protein